MGSKKIFFLVLFLFVLPALAQQPPHRIQLWEAPDFNTIDGIIRADTMTLKFNLYQHAPGGGLVRSRALQPGDDIVFELIERINQVYVPAPEYIKGSLQKHAWDAETGTDQGWIPDNITVSLLVDRSGSITTQEMLQIRNAVEAFVHVLPEGSLFLSYFHNFISTSYQLTRDTFEEAADTLLTRTPFHTDLYNAIITKLLEFDGEADIPNEPFERAYGYQRNMELAQRVKEGGPNYLIVLTDGADDPGFAYRYPNPKYDPVLPGFQVYNEDSVYKYVENYSDLVKVFTIGFGAESSDFEEDILRAIAEASGNPDGYIYVEPDNIFRLMQTEMIDVLRHDYSARFVNPPGKAYFGEQRWLNLFLHDPTSGFEARGVIHYALGSVPNPIIVEAEENVTQTILWGLLTGALIILLVLVLLQLIWPLINNRLFQLKYYRSFKHPWGEAKRTCPYCFEPITENEQVVMRCTHIVHVGCWESNGHACPEYGQNCTIGKQHYFDLNDPFSKKNKRHYLNWVFLGLIGGFVSWLVYMLSKDAVLFSETARTLADAIRGVNAPFNPNYVQKMAPLLAIGLIKGFFLSILFAYAEEFRRINIQVLLQFLVRGFAGAFIGFLSFVLGGIILMWVQVPFTAPQWDWIPWVFFGTGVGVSLSVRSTIHWHHGVLGGLLSMLFSFIVLFVMARSLWFLALTISFMIYGAGLGAAIATVRSVTEQYFLKVLNGPKAGSIIAIHKWMRAQGGLNEVFLGKSPACEIQINWDASPEIADKHLKLYVNSSRGVPVAVSLDKSKPTIYDQRIEMGENREYDLMNGVYLQIGNTLFQYVEST